MRFLNEALIKLGFATKIVDHFMECECGYITLERGICQGEPLSSYLFLVCMEGLTAIIKDYDMRNLINSIQVVRGAPLIAHMLFAGYTCIYCKTKTSNQVLKILNMFESASGYKINRAKSSYDKNTEAQTKLVVESILSFNEADEGTQYLGLPNIIHGKKSPVLGYLKDRLSSCIQGWDKKVLSKGGKKILLKTVAHVVPNYAMSVFLLPKELCSDLEKLMNKFWWKSSNGQNKDIYWMCWDKLSKRKSEGDLVFR